MRQIKASEAVGKRVRVKRICGDDPYSKQDYVPLIGKEAEIQTVIPEISGVTMTIDGRPRVFRWRELELELVEWRAGNENL